MTREELLARYPNASAAFLARNAENPPSQLRPTDPKPDQGRALERSDEGEAPCWYGSAKRFEITFTVYSVRPADYDGYDIKALQDVFVRAQILPDDKWNVLSGRVISRKARTKEGERTEIEIVTVDKENPAR